MLSDDELRKQGLERVPGASRGQDVRYFALHLTLNDIPESTPCMACGAPTQKEFLDHKISTETKSLVIRADGFPGYGCTKCDLKCFDPRTFLRLLNSAEGIAREAGEIELAEHLKKEADVMS